MKSHSNLIFLLLFAPLLWFVCASDRKIEYDIVCHLLSFFALTWFLIIVIKVAIVNTIICLIFYSALTEIGQLYLGFRQGEFNDFVADMTGILLFYLLHRITRLYGNRLPS